MKLILNFFERLVKCKGTDLLELQSGVFAIVWGAWVLNPFVVNMRDFGVYGRMLQWAPENAWGAIAFVVGLFKVSALVSGIYHLRSVACLICFTWWCFMTYSMLLCMPQTPGCGIILVQTITSGIVFLRVRYWNGIH